MPLRYLAMETGVHRAEQAPPIASNAYDGSGVIFPMVGSILLTLLWGAYALWDAAQILAPR